MIQALKSLFRKGDANVVKIICLGVGLAVGLTLLAEVIFQRSYDNFIPRLEDTYRIKEAYLYGSSTEWRTHPNVSGAVAPGIKSYCPEVEAATRFTEFSLEGTPFVSEDKKEVSCQVLMCDSSFFDIFPIPLLMGEQPRTGLEKEGNAYISRELLEALGENVIGRTLEWKLNPDLRVTVAGVFDNLPENTHLPRFNMMLALPTIKWVSWDGRDNWLGNDRYTGYVRLRPGTDPDRLLPNIERMMDDHISEALEKSGGKMDYSLEPVGDIFVSSDYNRVMNIVFLAFAVIMLLAALLNYVLLSISSMVNRAKSIATYRCYGAADKDICRMILSESFLYVGILSLGLAVLLIFGLQDFLQEQLGHSLRSVFTPRAVSVCLLVTLAVVVVCGMVPGYLYARIPVTYAYRRYSESKKRWKLGLLFVQFTLTALFVTLLTVIALQYHALTNYDAGFEYKHVLTADLGGVKQHERERCAQELRKLPGVVSVTAGYQSLASHCSGNNVYNPETGEEYMNVADMYYVSDDYHKTFQIPVIEGEVFTPHLSDTVTRQAMVSRNFVERMETLAGWTGSPIGKAFFLSEHGGPLTVCGVYEEIRIGSQMSEERDERPTVMFYHEVPRWNLYVRVQEMTPEVIREVQRVVSATVTSQEKIVTSLDTQISSLYDSLFRVRNSVLFAGLCVMAIALIGLLAYVRDEVARRRSEIAVRIIHGATVTDVERIFLVDLLRIALPAILLGTLTAWIISRSLLELFAVKIALTWCLFTFSAMAVLLLVMSLAAWLVWCTARINPTENLRTE